MIKKIEKPWGFEKLIEINDSYMFKLLYMKKNHRCSLQYHNYKTETLFIVSGKLRVLIGTDKNNLEIKEFNANESITIEKKIIHRMEAIEDTYYLESSSPEIDDVVRIQDDYNR